MPATKSDNIISCELQQNLHHATRLEWFRPVLSTLPYTKAAISAETCHENRASTQRPETQIPKAQPHPTPQKHHSPNANPNGTAHKTADLTKRCACAVNHTSTAYMSTRFHAVSRESDTSRFHPKPFPKASPNGSALAPYRGRLRTAANGCKRLRTVADAETTGREQGSTPRPPELNENPSLRIRENLSSQAAWSMVLGQNSLASRGNVDL